MPRYFFDIRTPSGVVCSDFQGLDCPDAAAALGEAQHGARFVSAEECERNPLPAGYAITVADEAHTLLFTVPFSEIQPGGSVPKGRAAKRRPSG